MNSARNPHGIEAITRQLLPMAPQRLVVVSPEGDCASIASVRLTRALADRGRRCVLVDMTGLGTIGLAMLDGNRLPGVTDLLTSERRFNEVIHSDRFSTAHVIPLGGADPALAMRSADRLPFILDALATVYDFVIVECGPSSAAEIKSIANSETVVMMSIVNPDAPSVTAAALDFDQSDYEDVVILMDEVEADR